MMPAKIHGMSRRAFLHMGVGALLLAVDANGLVWAATGKQYGADTMPGGTVDSPLVFIFGGAPGGGHWTRRPPRLLAASHCRSDDRFAVQRRGQGAAILRGRHVGH